MLITADLDGGVEVAEKYVEETDQFEETEEEHSEVLEEGDLLSHATSYSEFYMIDEKEEARLK